MRLEKVISRHRNDFHWLGKCEHCGTEQRYGDGYADHFYCTVVVPHRECPECGLRSVDEIGTPPKVQEPAHD